MKAKGDASLREKPKEKAEEKIPPKRFFGSKACVKKSKEGCKASESQKGMQACVKSQKRKQRRR